MKGDYGDQMGIYLDNSEYVCPYCKAPGSKSSLLTENLGTRGIDVAACQSTRHRVMCMNCGNLYTASKDAVGNITLGDGWELEGVMKGGYKSLKQQWMEAEEEKKETQRREARLAALKAEVDQRKAEIEAEEKVKATAEVEFDAKVARAVEKILGKRKVWSW
jgi:16S rRNA C967 or C1407 C5-methylase (RsmB/RsmF family)